MSRDKFSNECKGCRPVLIDPATGRLVSEFDPMMIAIERAWGRLSAEGKEAFHRVTCQNSRATEDLRLIKAFHDSIQESSAE